MLNTFPTFFDHSRHTLIVHDLKAQLDVLTFTGEETLSQPFRYTLEFTSSEQDIAAEQILGKPADFSLHTAPHLLPKVFRSLPTPEVKPLRTLHGVITSFKRLSGSSDEARYEVVFQPRLALLERGRQYRLYQHQSVPQIVESILRSRHDFEGQDFLFKLVRQYPPREQVMQYGESDLAFIARLLAEVGIWYRLTRDARLNIDVVEFHDDQRHYAGSLDLPYRPQSGLGSSGQDAVWGLQSSHEVVEKNLHFRAYDPREARAWLNGEVDQTRGAKTTYGEAYHYAEPYTALGDKLDQAEDLQSESGFFYGRLRHERYLNDQTRLSGVTSSASVALAQILNISGGAPQAFAPGAVITRLVIRAARDSSLEVSFEAIPWSSSVCFRPPLLAKPKMAGTIPARVTSSQSNDPYSHIDQEGRYKVSFLFDRDTWDTGEESLWLRLARPYAGDTHGLHLPLICGTEVAIAFEHGDPDRPYIAHALHDSQHPDHVTLEDRDYTRNVLRTPANNKLRMEDERGKEHVKLSTDNSGKSQLNLGHLVDAEKHKRGEGFELRTDGWGAIRGGKGVFISADAQAKAQGDQLDMASAVERLQHAAEQLQQISEDAVESKADAADVQAQINLLKDDLERLKSAVLLLSGPKGIALSSGSHLQLAAQENLMLSAGAHADLSVAKRLFMGVGQGLSLFVRKLGIKIFANEGPVTLHAQNDRMDLIARHGLSITSTTDEIHITAKKKIVLNAGGSYISMDPCRIESGTAGDYLIKGAYFNFSGQATQEATIPALPPLLDIPPEIQALHAWWPSFSGGRFDDGYYTPAPKKSEIARALKDQAELEEEEEEEELTDGITLRLGLFFDGTGNNQANAAATEQCREVDLVWFNMEELTKLQEVCSQYGFGDFDGTAFNSAPDNSYGNAPSNVVHLRELYPDNSTTPIKANANIGYASVYLEGIGTRSGGKDDTVYGQGLGQGETGVVARVKQAPGLIQEKLRDFIATNPETPIRRIEVDIFGFSRGAAAARHCANEFLKPGCGVFGEVLQPGNFGLQKRFDPAVHLCLNFIGLFDTVAAISTLERGDFSVGDDTNYGVNLYLPPGCARQVIQLQALDEYRANFSLNSVGNSHKQIGLPGVHSDIGGGYRARARENIWLTVPRRATVEDGQRIESHRVWGLVERDANVWRATGMARDGSIEIKTWPAAKVHRGKSESAGVDYWITAVLDRPIHGELSLIPLRVMRELGVRHGVPFDVISDTDKRFQLPEELKPIAETILKQVMAGTEVKLAPEQEALLRARYIHQSAHWTPSKTLMINKPVSLNRRYVYPDQPQKGYPQ
ncbi:type VI secretion system tip protein VgrG [Pseudomonas abietaniphila]